VAGLIDSRRIFNSWGPHISTFSSDYNHLTLKSKGSPYSITERRVPELISVLGSQSAGDVSHKPDFPPCRPAVTPATLKRAASNFAAW